MRRSTSLLLLCGGLTIFIGGCASNSRPSGDTSESADSTTTPRPPQRSTPDAGEIYAAEQAAEQIERARESGDWATVNTYLSSVGYTPKQRNAAPSGPFAEVTRKLGDLRSHELLLSIGGADYHDRSTGRYFPMVNVNLRETYSSAPSRPINMEFGMLKEDGQWKLAGVGAYRGGRR